MSAVVVIGASRVSTQHRWQDRIVVTRSAGLLLYRCGREIEVLLGHMGGPLWSRRDRGAWTIPKGEYRIDETALAAAQREFVEELGVAVPDGDVIPLGDVRQAGGKLVTAWAVRADIDIDCVQPGMFTMEWPPRSGVMQQYPELDRVAWLTVPDATEKIIAAQRTFLERLCDHVRS